MMLTVIAFVALAAWIYLTLFRGGFWRADIRLEPAPAPRDWPEVVAIIPARHERETIAPAIAAHQAADYTGRLSIILVDDGSADGTAEAAKSAAGRREMQVPLAPPLASGWTGKLAAMNAGLATARSAHPGAKYILFADADIVFAPTTLSRLVAKAEDETLALVSLMSRLDARGVWAALLIPAFVYFFQMLYPFRWSNDPARRTAAAAGGCMLVRRDALEAAGGLDAIRGDLIDDCALARLVKRQNRIWIGLAEGETSSLRDNRGLGSIWSMVARSAYTELKRSPLLLAGTILGMALAFIAPPAIALAFPLHKDEWAGVAALSAWLAMTATFLPTVALYGGGPARAAALPLAAALYVAMTASSALDHWRGRGGRWKGRVYAGPRETG